MKPKDLTSQRFGKLVVIEQNGYKSFPCGSRKVLWKCKCDCGNTTIVTSNELSTGHVKSCGCLQKETSSVNGKKNKKHGMADSRIYYIWSSMKARCNNPNLKAYHNYGGRGITVCDEWKDNFEAFKEWALKNGYSDDLTIERKDVDGNYCPENCCWITLSEQGKNRRNSLRFIDIDGNEKLVSEVAEKNNIPMYTVRLRVNRGWDVEKAVTTPILNYATISLNIEAFLFIKSVLVSPGF